MAHVNENLKASNMVMLGATAPFVHINEEISLRAIETVFALKVPVVVELNWRLRREGSLQKHYNAR